MNVLDSRIDELYSGPLDTFITRRNALAKTLSGADAARVKGLVKPLAVPWAVNQVYWTARSIYERALESGSDLRRAQLAALKSAKGGDVHAATEAHRKAISAAVAAASRIAAAAGLNPGTDGLKRTFEALSLAKEPPELPGRLTAPLQPAGFEALAGVSLPEAATRKETTGAAPREKDARKAREDAERERRNQQAIAKGEAAVDRAREVERRAREAWERARRDVDEAQDALTRLRNKP